MDWENLKNGPLLALSYNNLCSRSGAYARYSVIPSMQGLQRVRVPNIVSCHFGIVGSLAALELRALMFVLDASLASKYKFYFGPPCSAY